MLVFSARQKFYLVGIFVLLMMLGGWSKPTRAKDSNKQSSHREQTGGDKIVWQTNFKQTLALAKKEDKYVLIDLYTDECAYCKLLDKNVFPNPQVAKYMNKHFIPMKANARVGDGILVNKLYKVSGYPHAVITDNKGKQFDYISGYLSPREYLGQLKDIIKVAKANGK